MNIADCSNCNDYFEDDAYCHCCYGALISKIAALEKEIEKLRGA